MTKHLKALKKMKPSGSDKHSRKKAQKRIDGKREHLKVLIKYINKDYETVKSRLVHSACIHFTSLLRYLSLHKRNTNFDLSVSTRC